MVIGFEPVFNRVSESGGNAVLILKVLMGTLMKSVVVNFTTEDSSAIGKPTLHCFHILCSYSASQIQLALTTVQ